MLAEVEYCSRETLMDVAARNPFAINVKSADCALLTTASIRVADAAMLVSPEYGAYESILTHVIDAAGLTQLNTPTAVDVARDKWISYQALTAAGIAMPKAKLAHDLDEALSIAEELGYPVVVKELTGLGGKGVLLAKDPEEMVSVAQRLHVAQQPLMVQHYIECGAHDKRVLVINNEIVDAMGRQAKEGEFRANLAMGATGTPHVDVMPDEAEMVNQATAVLGLSLAGIDTARVTEVLPGREYLPAGKTFCIEGNPSPGLKGHPGFPPKVVDMLIKRIHKYRHQAVAE